MDWYEEQRLDKELPIEGLGSLFVGGGLPLIPKADEIPPTTSILVRGGAGVGKTTLAVALARGIARKMEGAVLYVTTEIFPTEIRYKARWLGLAETDVLPWDQRAQAREGAFVVRHLALEVNEEQASSVEARSEAALDVAWRLVEQYGREQMELPVRVVVIDAFGLPERTSGRHELRTPVLQWMQALELRGISPILIEEMAAGADDALTFLTDIVLEIRQAVVSTELVSVSAQLLGQTSTTRNDLVHQLTLTKSRYIPVKAGPHQLALNPDGGGLRVQPLVVSQTQAVLPAL